MTLPTAPFHVLLSTLVVLAATIFLTSETVAAGARSIPPPLSYRYAGVVETGSGVPAHNVRRGGGVIFYFFDSFSQGIKSQPYRLCVGRPGKAAAFCWTRTARYGVGKVAFAFTLPPRVPLGALTARWLVAGRAVASWPFFYAQSD
jgi:hypothetical protein